MADVWLAQKIWIETGVAAFKKEANRSRTNLDPAPFELIELRKGVDSMEPGLRGRIDDGPDGPIDRVGTNRLERIGLPYASY
jgi:hypothetical protein